MNQEDAEDMADLAFGGSSAVSGDASECTVNMLASRVCSRGTKGCILNHSEDFLASQASPAKRGAEPSDYCRTVNEFSDEERERAVTAYTLSHYNAAPDFGFAPDRAWLEGYGHAALAQSAPSKRGTEPSLDAEVKKRIAANVYAHCAQIPGANSYTAAEFAITETLEALAQSAPSEKLAGAEPVVWQWRKKGEPWTQDKTFLCKVYATTDDTEVRALYSAASHAQTVPQVPAGQMWGETLLEPLTEDEVFRFMQSVSESPRNSVTARILSRYWKTHPASMQPEAPPRQELLRQVNAAFAEIAMAYPAAYKMAKVFAADRAVLASLQPEAAGAAQPSEAELLADAAPPEPTRIDPAPVYALLRRALGQLTQWQRKYGEHDPAWLPPSGDVKLAEDIDAMLNQVPLATRTPTDAGGAK